MENPYQEGNQLRLTICQRGRSLAISRQQHEITVIIVKVMPEPTMSVVMKVEFVDRTSLGATKSTAVLKMYDRRFSPGLRRRYNPTYDDEEERAWHKYVQDGGAPALFSFMQEKMDLELNGELVDTDSDTDHDSSSRSNGGGGGGCDQCDGDNDVESSIIDEGYDEATDQNKKKKEKRKKDKAFAKKGKREGIIQWRSLELWRCETQAYKKLVHLQGYCVPQLFAVVSLSLSQRSPASAHLMFSDKYVDDEDYSLAVGGILVEYIEGFNLCDLGTQQPTVSQDKWHSIIQQAVTATEDINDSGVINYDCQPRNVMVDQRTLIPKHIDLAQCLLVEEVGWKEFKSRQYSEDNPHAIGSVMISELKNTVGFGSSGGGLKEIRYRERYWGWFGSVLVRLRFLPWTMAQRWTWWTWGRQRQLKHVENPTSNSG